VRSPFLYGKNYQVRTDTATMNREHSKLQYSDLTGPIFVTVSVVSQFMQFQIIWGRLNILVIYK